MLSIKNFKKANKYYVNAKYLLLTVKIEYDIIEAYRRCNMISYNPLWHTLLDKNMKKLELCKVTGISTSTLAKLSKNQNVNIDIINKICTSLNCRIEDVVEILPE